MNRIKKTASVLLLLSLCAVSASVGTVSAEPTPASAVALQRWEYKTFIASFHGGKELRDAGADGWELVTVVKLDGGQLAFYLKRPLQR